MPNPFTLAIGLKATTSGLSGGLKKAEGLLNSFAGRITGIAALATGAFTGLAIGSGIKTALDEIDAVRKNAGKIGATTDELIGLEHAAGLAGVAANDMHRALIKNADILNALRDSKNKGPLTAMGLDAQKLIDMPLDQRIGAIADGLTRLRDPAAQVAAAIDLLGKKGADLLPMFVTGSAGIQAARKEADLLGLTVGDTGFDIEAVNDAWLRLKMVGTGVFRQLVIAMAPLTSELITGLIPTMRTLAIMFIETFTAGGESMLSIMPILDAVNAGIGFMLDMWTGAQGIFHILSGAITKFLELTARGVSKLAALFGFEDLANNLRTYEQEFGRSANASLSQGAEEIENAWNGTASKRFRTDVEALRVELDKLALPSQHSITTAGEANAATAAKQSFPAALLKGTAAAAAKALELQFGKDKTPEAHLKETQKTNEILTKISRNPLVLAEADL